MARWQRRDWLNGHYELLMIFEESCAWVGAAQALWGLPQLSGVWTQQDFDPDVDPRQDAQDILVTTDLMDKNLLGVAQLPNGKAVPCGMSLSSFDEWLTFFLPLAGLELAYDVGAFPWGDGNRPWITELDDWLAEIGRQVFCQVPFKVAAVGFEIHITSVFDIDTTGPIKVPERRDCGLLVPVGQEVKWYAST